MYHYSYFAHQRIALCTFDRHLCVLESAAFLSVPTQVFVCVVCVMLNLERRIGTPYPILSHPIVPLSYYFHCVVPLSLLLLFFPFLRPSQGKFFSSSM